MTQHAVKPPLDDVENPAQISDTDLKTRLKTLGRDLGFTESSPPSSSPSTPPTSRQSGSAPAPPKTVLDTLQVKLPRYLISWLQVS
jgi:hypothetical protein